MKSILIPQKTQICCTSSQEGVYVAAEHQIYLIRTVSRRGFALRALEICRRDLHLKCALFRIMHLDVHLKIPKLHRGYPPMYYTHLCPDIADVAWDLPPLTP